jgi:hypothetical protein
MDGRYGFNVVLLKSRRNLFGSMKIVSFLVVYLRGLAVSPRLPSFVAVATEKKDGSRVLFHLL